METETNEPPDRGTVPEASTEPPPKAAPIESRFLFVDIAAMRAKQLRRGALPRLSQDGRDLHRTAPHKAERVAMEEVRRGLVYYDLPQSSEPRV